MFLSHKFTIESITIVTAVAILALVFGGMLGDRAGSESGKQLSLKQGVEQSQGTTAGTIQANK